MNFFKFVMTYGSKYLAGSAIAGVIAGIINTLLIKMVNTELQNPGDSSLTIFVLLIAAGLAFNSLSLILINKLACDTTHQLRLSLFRHILKMPLRKLESMGNSMMTSSFSQDPRTIVDTLVKLPSLITSIVVTVGCLIYLGILSWPIFLILLGFIAFTVASYQIPEKYAIRFMKVHRRVLDRLYRQFEGLLLGIKELKLSSRRRGNFFTQVLLPTTDEARGADIKHRNLYAVLNSWQKLMYFAFLTILLYLVPKFIETDAALLVSFAITVLFLIGPLDEVVSLLPAIHLGRIAYNHLQKIGLDPMMIGKHEAEVGRDQDCSLVFLELRLVGVRHRFRRDNELHSFELGPINLSLGVGELVFLVGGNGSGKTTLAKVLCGLYPPESGHLELNGERLDSEDMNRYRQLFAAIFTEFYVFESLLGVPDVQFAEKVNHYLRLLYLDSKVEVKDNRLSTTSLSTGQRKRLALLAAYLEDRPCYLFDEWAADQDPEFKRVFYEDLLPDLKRRGKAVFVISHDDRYFHLADRLLRLEDGQLIDTPVPELQMAPAQTDFD